ncbi:hypothetical protein VHEMI02960 [[Torrubiella] hemipterigena]|uniref:Uncharacterized protein n=1 Tax=[Torrubiella] hemipterigena TaxID=1531966 RepID=A0A0A1T9P3_9HYPO|nr:hypothetical protein VHEMI02960 [[Torrubiella] hemipterigena]
MPSLSKLFGRKSKKQSSNLLSPEDAVSGQSRTSSVVGSDAPSDLSSQPAENRQDGIDSRTAEASQQTGALPTEEEQQVVATSIAQPEAAPPSLWERAYENLREENSSLIKEYEKLLAKHLLSDLSLTTTSETSVDQKKMQQITKLGLESLNESRLKYTIAGMEFVVIDQVAQVSEALIKFKEYVADAIKASPEASMAWAGVCVILPLFTNPSTVEAANKEGFSYVASRMGFYSGLEPLLWPQQVQLRQDLRTELETSLVKLYTALITFHVESALRFYRNWFGRTIRDMVKFEPWESMLKSVKDAEAVVGTYFDKVNDVTVRKGIEELGDTAARLLEGLKSQTEVATQQLEVSKEQVAVSKDQLTVSKQQLDAITQLASSLSINNTHINLNIVPEAQYHSADTAEAPRCLEGTRASIRKRLLSWSESTTGPNIFWLNGSAGTGKSTIARTIADSLDENGTLAAGYFFKRGDETRNKMVRVLPTLLHQVVRHIVGLKACVSASLGSEDGDALDAMSLDFQFEKLFDVPLRTLEPLYMDHKPQVIIIDALDESIEQNLAYKLLFELAKLGSKHPRFNVLVTSRATTELELVLENLAEKGRVYEVLRLQEEFAEETKEDIEAFLRSSFAEIRKKRKIKRDTWPTEEDIQLLLSRATDPSPLFVYASSLIRFIDRFSPTKQLEKWLQLSSTSNDQLHEIYQPILTDAFLPFDDEQLHAAKSILQLVILAVTPLSASSISELLDVDCDDVHEILRQFHAVIQQSEDSNRPISLHHKSFSDYLLSEPTSVPQTAEYRINSIEGHRLYANKCLEYMNARLRKDILSLGDFSQKESTVSYEQREVITEALEYSCKQWTLHTTYSCMIKSDPSAVESFLKQHFLHWLECLVWINAFPQAVSYVVSLEKEALAILPPSSYLVLCLSDARRFIPSLNEFIFTYPLQLYCTGLVFAPTDTFLRNEFWHEGPKEISKVEGIAPEWDTTLQLLPTPRDMVSVLAFSPNGALLASASWFGAITIFDTISGIDIVRLQSPTRIDTIVFSPDGTMIAALDENGSMLFWDIHSGQLENTIKNCPNLLMTFNNQQGNRQVYTQKLSFPDDGRAWHVKAWRMTQIIPRLKREGMDAFIAEFMTKYGDTYNWFQVFSDDGSTVASPTAMGAIAVWDVYSGRLKAKFGAHQDLLCGLLLSPNGSTIISNAQSAKTTHITEKYAWDIASGSRIADFGDFREALRVQLSSETFLRHSNKLCFHTSSGLALWDIDSKALTHAAFEKPARPDIVVSFDDNLCANVLSNGHSIRIYRPLWKLTGGTQETYQYLKMDPETDAVKQFTISSKGVIALQYDYTIEFRDLATGKCLYQDIGLSAHKPEGARFSNNGETVMYMQSSESLVVRNTHDFSTAFSVTLYQNLYRTAHDRRFNWSYEALSPDGNLLAVACENLPVTVYDINSGLIVGSLDEVKPRPDPFYFSPQSDSVTYYELVQDSISAVQTTFLVFFEFDGEAWHRRWRAADQVCKCFTHDGSRLLTRRLAEQSEGSRWEILSAVDGSRLLFVTPIEEVLDMDYLAEFEWVQVSTDMMVPAQAVKYLKSRMSYLNTETGELELRPEVKSPVDLLFRHGWLICNGKPIIFVPESLSRLYPEFGIWKNTAYHVSKDRLVWLDMVIPA